MTEFRGVQKEELIDSIDRALGFLKGLDLGPETGAAVELLQETNIRAQITQAETEVELSDVMRNSGALPYLSQFHDVFAFHAAAEAAGGKGHEVQDLYRDLMAWSAFFDETVKPDLRIEKEIRAHVVFHALDRLAEAAPDVQEAVDGKLHEVVADVGQKDKKLAGWLEETVPVYQLLYSGEPSDELTDLLKASTSSQGACLQKALYTMSGLPAQDEALAVPQAMDLYKIAVNNEEGAMPENRWMIHVQDVRRKMLMAMLPFARTAQTARIEIRPLTVEKDQWSFSFIGTKRAAQSAALALDKFKYSVIDAKGQKVEAVKPPLLLPPPGPAPGMS